MKLYGAPNPAPNPRRVRIFLAEKGVSIPEEPVNLRKREHKSPEFRTLNPAGQIPVLELDDGRTLSETVAICRYLESLHPEPPLFGRDAFETAEIEMWTRRVEFVLMTPVGQFWRHAHPYTAHLLTQFTDFGESNRERVAEGMRWFDRQLQDRPFIAGERFTIADICALTTVDFADYIGLPIPETQTALKAWRERVTARPSASA